MKYIWGQNHVCCERHEVPLITSVPGGAKGVLLKLYSHSKTAYADNFGFERADRRRLKIYQPVGEIYTIVGEASYCALYKRPAMKWFLKAWLAL